MSDQNIDLNDLLNSEEFRRRSEEINKVLDDSEAVVKQAFGSMSSTSKQEMQKIRGDLDAFGKYILKMEQGVASLEQQSTKVSGVRQQRVGGELEAARQALAANQAVYAELSMKAEAAAEANLRLCVRLEELRDEMKKLESAGQGNSDAFQDVKKEAASTAGALKGMEDRLKGMSQQTGICRGIIEGLDGVAGVAGVAQGALALFGKENEDLIRIISSLQAVQQMAVGVEVVAAAAHRNSAFQIKIVTGAKKAWAAATTFLNTQLGISVGLSKALMAGGVGLLIAGVGVLVGKLMSMGEESKTAGENVRDTMDTAAASYGKTKVELDKYIAILHDETAALSEKMKVQEYLQNNVPGYFATLDKEGKLVRENTTALEKYNETLMQRAMLSAMEDEEKVAMADLGKAARMKKQAEDHLNSFDNPILKVDNSQENGMPRNVISEKTLAEVSYAVANTNYLKAKEAVDKLREEKNSIVDELRKIESGFSGEATTIGVEIRRLETEKKRLEEEYRSVRADQSDADIQKEQVRINQEKELIEKRLEFLKLSKGAGSGKSDDKKKQEQLDRALNEAILANEMKLEQERLAVMQDGRAKRLRESELEHQQRQAAIEQDRAALSKSYSEAGQGDLADEDKVVFSKRMGENDDSKIERDREIERSYDNEVASRAKALTDVLVTEESRRTAAIRERYEKEREWANRNISDPAEKSDYLGKVDQAEKHDNTFELLEKYKTYVQKRREIDDKYSAGIRSMKNAGADEESVAMAEKEKQDTLAQLDSAMASKDQQFQSMLDKLTRMSMRKLRAALSEAETALKGIESNGGTDSTQAGVEREKIKAVKKQMDTLDKKQDVSNADKWKGTLDVMQRAKTTVDGMIGSFKGLDETTKEALTAASNVAGGVISMIGGIQTLAITGANAVKGVERASVILTIISAAVQVTMILFNLFNKDKKSEKKIQALQKEVDNLARSYDKLGKAMETTYSNKVYGQMDEQQENLTKQQELLRQQIEEENGKKKSDQGKIDEWKNKIEDIDQQKADIERKRIEMLAGTDVKSAISTFSDALVQAYEEGGEKGSKILADTTRKMMANAVKEALEKKFLGDAMKDAVDFLGKSMDDGVLSAGEQSSFEAQMKAAGDNFTRAMKAYDELFKGKIVPEEDPNSARGQIQGQLTEQTGSEFLGLTRVQLDVSRQNKDINAEILAVSKTDTLCFADQLRQQVMIQENTLRTANNTDGLREELATIKTTLQNIDKKGGGLYGK